ncbi:CusA/CzcA family heavy metal efflux RND transporter [Pedobacter sp. JCM 36344]|uniref:CusA/CzcA family heavy metal efflux RND transporter n=1 Tax=Pedobacter sp. JCM 36344 TaxID=3374280 RepID=UPI00397BF94E
MLNKIIEFSIKQKLLIGIMMLALIAWGIYSLRQLPIDALPDITNNQVQIITSSPSNGAEDIERFVTYPVEQTMATIPGVEEIRSFSRFGLSVVTIVFKENIEIYWARQQVNERLKEVERNVPKGMGVPEIAPLTTGLGEIYQYIIHTKKGYEKKFYATSLRTIQDWIVRRQLLGVEGIADVSSFGGYLKQYEVSIDPDKLRSMNISISEIFNALEKNNQNTGGSYIDKKPNAYFIRSQGLIGSMEDIENIVVRSNQNGIPVLIRDVSEVRIGAATRYGAMTRNDEGEVVGAVVMMLKGANSSKVIANVKAKMEQISKTLPEGVVIEPFLDRTKLVNSSISTVTRNLAEGALIVIFVLVLLLGNLRAGLIVASVIPLAMLFAVCLMNLFGVSGNLMSLGAIDFGLIVDGAVIIVEASLHHLGMRNNKNRLTQQEMDLEIYKSASKIRNSAAFGEIIILIVYLPILALVGIEGKMFRPMAQTVAFAILGAFILSLTYVPMMSALFLNKQISTKRNISDRIMDWFQRGYTPMLNFALRARVLVVSISVVLFVICLFIFQQLGSEFIPTLEEGDFAVETRVLTGSSLSQTIEAATRAAKVLKANFPEVKEVIGKIGSAEIPTDPMPVEACDLIIILKDKDEWTTAGTREELANKMQAKLEQYIPGVTFGFQQPIQMRFNELMTGARQDVVIKVYGEDFGKLAGYASKIGAIANKIKGAEDVYVEQVSGLPQVIVKFHRDKIAQFGLNIEDVNTALRSGFAGEVAGLVFEGEKRFEMVVRLKKENRQSIEDVKNLFVTGSNGAQVPLAQLADIAYTEGPNQIQRDDAKRRITIGFNTRGRDVESIVKEIQRKINDEVKFDPGYYPTYGGTFENLRAANERLAIAVPLALLLILLLLYLTFNSLKHALLIFTAIPLSALGGVLALWIRGMPFSISAGIGFIALFGVAVLNGIVLISEFNRLKKEGMTDILEIIRRGTSVRLRPVILTALVASLGFLPMALSAGSGAEVQRPLATVVIGGLLSATLLTLLVLPILYIWVEKLGKPKTSNTIVIMAFTILFGFAGMGATAQTNKVTLEQAINLALENNPNINGAKLSVELQQQLKQTAFEMPKTDVSVLYGQYNSIVNNDNNFSISQKIPFPTLFAANESLGTENIKASKLMMAATKNELISQVKSVYFNLQYLHSKAKLLTQQDSIYQGFLKSAALRYKTGEATLLEKVAAETQLQDIQSLLKQNSSDLKIYGSQFAALLGNDKKVDISAQFLIESPNLSSLMDSTATGTNPTLSYLRQLIVVADGKRKVETAKALPDLNVSYFNQSLTGFQNVNGNEVFYGRNKRFQSVQIGLTIPVFFGAYSAKAKAASIGTSIAKNDLNVQQRNFTSQYQQAIQNYLKSKDRYTYFVNSALVNAVLILKNSRLAYQNGEIGYSEHLLNLKQVNAIKESHIFALLELYQSINRIEFLNGYPTTL